MARRYRLSALLPAAAASAVALVLVAWGAQPPRGDAAAASPQTARESPPAGRQRVKPSEPPHLALFFTDQVVGYIQPCG